MEIRVNLLSKSDGNRYQNLDLVGFFDEILKKLIGYSGTVS